MRLLGFSIHPEQFLCTLKSISHLLTPPPPQEALCWVLANICAGGSYITSNVSGGFVFDALAACLRDFEAHAGVAESTACAVHFLLSDRAVMRSQPLDAEIPSALIRVAREHPKNPRVALAVLLALVRAGAERSLATAQY